MAQALGGEVKSAGASEYGRTEVDIDQSRKLFDDISKKTIAWMSHTDYIAKTPAGMKTHVVYLHNRWLFY